MTQPRETYPLAYGYAVTFECRGLTIRRSFQPSTPPRDVMKTLAPMVIAARHKFRMAHQLDGIWSHRAALDQNIATRKVAHADRLRREDEQVITARLAAEAAAAVPPPTPPAPKPRSDKHRVAARACLTSGIIWSLKDTLFLQRIAGMEREPITGEQARLDLLMAKAEMAKAA